MLHIIGHELAHRTIARLFGAYDVVVVDTRLKSEEDEGAAFPFSPAQTVFRDLLRNIAHASGLDIVRFAPDENGASPGDGPMALHVLVGLHALDEGEAERMHGFVRHYSSVKNAAAQRLLVLTDSLPVRAEPHGWSADPRIAVVHIEGS